MAAHGEAQPLSARAVACYSAANFGASAVAAFGNAALPLYLASYGVSNAAIGFLAQERSFVGGLAQPIVGVLSDRTRTRWGRRRPFFLAGVPLVLLTLALLATRPPLLGVVLLLTVLAFFLAVAYDPYLALLADIVPSRQRGRVGGALAVTNMLGQMALLAAASVLWESNEGLVFALTAGAVVVGFSITFVGVREPRATDRGLEAARDASPSRGEERTGDRSVARVDRSPHPGPLPGWEDVPAEGLLQAGGGARRSLAGRAVAYGRGVLGHRELATYVGVTGLFWLGNGGVVPFLTRYAVEELGVDTGTAFRLMLVAVASTALFAMPAGMLGDRFGKRPVLMLGLAAFGAGCLAGAAARTVEQAVVILAAIGVANAACTVLLFPLLADFLPKDRAGELTGFGSAVWSITQPLGAVGAGLLADATGSLRSALALAGLLALASATLLTRVERRETREERRE